MKNIIVILGPTGVGKTKMSVELAKKINAEVINADSVQVYKKLNIGSGKVTKDEMEGVTHHLFDIVDAESYYSVYDYQKNARRKIDEILKKGKRVILVGGTGLYIKAALYDYKFSKEDKHVNMDNYSNDEIYEMIKNIDKDINIDKNNRQRLERYYNRLINNDVKSNGKDKCLYDIDLIGLTTERNNLYNIIDKRVDSMFQNGLVDEINSLKEDYKTSRVLNTAIGYKEFKDYFDGKSLEYVKDEIKKNSRHYAKRQYTFFNNQFDNIKWFDVNYKNFDKTANDVYNYIRRVKDE